MSPLYSSIGKYIAFARVYRNFILDLRFHNDFYSFRKSMQFGCSWMVFLKETQQIHRSRTKYKISKIGKLNVWKTIEQLSIKLRIIDLDNDSKFSVRPISPPILNNTANISNLILPCLKTQFPLHPPITLSKFPPTTPVLVNGAIGFHGHCWGGRGSSHLQTNQFLCCCACGGYSCSWGACSDDWCVYQSHGKTWNLDVKTWQYSIDP